MECGIFSKLNGKMLKAFNQTGAQIHLCFGKISQLFSKELCKIGHVCKDGNRVSERVNKLPKVTQLEGQKWDPNCMLV